VLALSAAVLLAVGLAALWWVTGLGTDGAARDDAAALVRAAADSAAHPVEWEKLCAANSRGVGLMERFEYSAAVNVFEGVVEMAPDWLPGRINLGIALLNAGGAGTREALETTREVFESVLRLDPDNKHAHHCLGALLMYQKEPDEAIAHFEAVTRLDPTDPAAWVFLGTLLPQGQRRDQCFRKAIEADPYYTGALFQEVLRTSDPERRRERWTELTKLKEAGWDHQVGIRYGEMGKYAEVIASPARPAARASAPLSFARWPLTVRLAEGARWAREADLTPLARAARRRFGGTIVQLDYDGDGKLDLFLASAVVENGKARDLLLRKGKGGYTDVTAQSGLVTTLATLGVAVGDFDNDGKPDLLLTGANGVRLFRNTGGAFEDVTAKAGMDKLTGVFLGAAFVDLDQDSDLDLVLTRFADNPEAALALLHGKAKPAGGKLVVFLNTGTGPSADAGRARRGLSCDWEPAELPGLSSEGAAFPVISDVDGDGDLDVVILAEGRPPVLIANDRLLRFHRVGLAGTKIALWNGGLVLDLDNDGRSDVLLLRSGLSPSWLPKPRRDRTAPVAPPPQPSVEGPPLRHAVAIDLDRDGWTDVVGLSQRGAPVLLHNDRGKLKWRRDALGPPGLWPKDLIALTVQPDPVRPILLGWSESEGLLAVAPRDNGNSGLLVWLEGRSGIQAGSTKLRCNADGVGAWVQAHAGGQRSGIENTTLCAGLGQSRLPLLLGLGPRRRADLLRLRWPDGVRQAELNVAGREEHRIAESSRKTVW
jgi:tetratricopeptide (TPR) repeat protein